MHFNIPFNASTFFDQGKNLLSVETFFTQLTKHFQMSQFLYSLSNAMHVYGNIAIDAKRKNVNRWKTPI